MSPLMSLYGFSAYDEGEVDERHRLACPGCTTCIDRLDRAIERDYLRNPPRKA